MTCWPPFSAGTGIQGNPCVCNGGLRGRYNGGAFTKTVIDCNDVRHYRWLDRDLLDFAGLSPAVAYITSVFIDHIGTDSIGSLIKRFAAKKRVNW